MNRHQFLRALHATARPRNYLEIGVNDGRSLALSRVPSVAVDPAYRVTAQLRCDLHLVRATSDDFFASPDPIVHLRGGRNPWRNLRRGRPLLGRYTGGTVIDLAFIDGMHLFEFALRDFMNVERFSRWTSLIVLDDMLPRNADEAARERHTRDWTGDVFKLAPVLRRYRPDLTVLPIDTTPTGLLVVLGADPGNSALRDRYDRIVADVVTPDPQRVSTDVLERRGAIAPDAFLASPILDALVRGRRTTRDRGYPRVRELAFALARDAGAAEPHSLGAAR